MRELASDAAWDLKDPEHVAWLCKETVEVSMPGLKLGCGCAVLTT